MIVVTGEVCQGVVRQCSDCAGYSTHHNSTFYAHTHYKRQVYEVQESCDAISFTVFFECDAAKLEAAGTSKILHLFTK
jgi:hypothetical protein